MRDLVAGERVALGDEVALSLAEPLRPPLSLTLVALDGARRGSAAFPPIDADTRELRPGVRFDEGGRLVLALRELPDAVERLLMIAFLSSGPGGGTSLRDFPALTLLCDDLRFRIDLTDRADTAAILAELYRHGGGWRLRADGGGFVHGLPAVAEAFGLDRGWAERLGATRPGARPGPDRHPPRGSETGGSGVAVDRRHILSNAHVVEDAREITVSGDGRTAAAELVFADPRNDLALLRVEGPIGAAARFRVGLDLHLGEEVVALGFPLQGLLGSGPQASSGNISGLCGVGNDSSLFQFTAPIASGNSGGPILDAGGQVIGLVRSSLNLDWVRAGGASGENINFGIKGAVVRSFLDAYGLSPELAEPGAALPRAQMVRAARETIFRIACRC